jgi:hypothetical protein
MSEQNLPVTGGCQCGAVRYASSVALSGAHICHCRMCQKAVGNAFAALVAAPREAVVWTRGQPVRFASSDQVERGFCAACGTPLFYDYVAGPRINLTIGSLDNPAAVPPERQFGSEGRQPWFAGLGALPDEGTTEETMASVAPAIAASNRQHPDHDTPD